MSIDGALTCARNDSGDIPIDIQADFLYLIRGKKGQ